MDDRPGDIDDTVVRPRAPRHDVPPTAPDLDDTVIRLIEPTAEQRRPVPVDRLPDALIAAASSEAPLSAASSRATSSAAGWGMRVRGTSTVVPLDVPAVIGRRPGLARPTEHPAPRRVVIPADRADVSARHVRIELLGQSIVVSDLGSTNGVVVHWSTGSSLRLRSAESCAVLPDAIIELGDGVEIEFVAPNNPLTPRPSEHS